ncbi:MAG: GTP-dependent dephospho-CoA kinase family protein [Nitrososphaeria archaeon]|nr:GTP-dependent dephospho-CoA kinase family protein [Nitrososphaeria archaeon]
MHVWILNENLAQELKKPLGLLIKNDSYKVQRVLSRIRDCKLLVSVGDATLDFLLSINIVPDIQIVDIKEKRLPRNVPKPAHKVEFHVSNPRGCITEESIEAFKASLCSNKPVRILVDGEEDLLALVAIIFSPKGSCVLYGQPDEGLVIVDVEERVKEFCEKIFSSMTLSKR